MHTTNQKTEEFERLLSIINELREKCPWDREQTFESLRVQTIEETFELSDAIMDGDMFNIRKELGDLLLHVVFYSQMGSEVNNFDIYDVCHSLNEKLIFRHPHVFKTTKVDNAKQVEQNWEQLKLKEKDGNKSVLSGVPNSLPALIKAQRIQDKARSVGFDWELREQVWSKVEEEIGEFKQELCSMNKESMEAEFGDLLFSLVNAARLYGINPENALELTNRKFIKRFNYLESKTISQGLSLADMTLAEMDSIWEEAKSIAP